MPILSTNRQVRHGKRQQIRCEKRKKRLCKQELSVSQKYKLDLKRLNSIFHQCLSKLVYLSLKKRSHQNIKLVYIRSNDYKAILENLVYAGITRFGQCLKKSLFFPQQFFVNTIRFKMMVIHRTKLESSKSNKSVQLVNEVSVFMW